MHSSTVTKLPLARFAQLMGIHPLHFSGVWLQDMRVCGGKMRQHEWQATDAVSREEIARKIRDAEETLERELNFRLLPTWEVDEWRPMTAPRAGSDPWTWAVSPTPVITRWKHLISGGVRAQEPVELSATITWSDEDSDGYFETGTITTTVDFEDPTEAHLYYPGKDGASEWEIRPLLTAEITGTTLVATFRRENAVLESFDNWLAAPPDLADGTNNAHFLAEVDVYRVYNDPQTQVRFMWEPLINNCGCSLTSGCPSCQYHVQTGCMIIRDDRLGLGWGSPSVWDSDELAFTPTKWAEPRRFDIARLNYYSGLREKQQEFNSITMSTYWAETVSMLAAARMDRKMCACATDYFAQWRDDLAYQKGAEQTSTYWISDRLKANPFGTRRGEVEAWRRVNMSQAAVAAGAVPHR